MDPTPYETADAQQIKTLWELAKKYDGNATIEEKIGTKPTRIQTAYAILKQ